MPNPYLECCDETHLSDSLSKLFDEYAIIASHQFEDPKQKALTEGLLAQIKQACDNLSFKMGFKDNDIYTTIRVLYTARLQTFMMSDDNNPAPTHTDD